MTDQLLHDRLVLVHGILNPAPNLACLVGYILNPHVLIMHTGSGNTIVSCCFMTPHDPLLKQYWFYDCTYHSYSSEVSDCCRMISLALTASLHLSPPATFSSCSTARFGTKSPFGQRPSQALLCGICHLECCSLVLCLFSSRGQHCSQAWLASTSSHLAVVGLDKRH